MRLGFILGFLLGGGAASLLSGVEHEEGAVMADLAAPKQLLAKLRLLLRDAKQAGRDASKQKQAEMLAEYEAAKRRPHR